MIRFKTSSTLILLACVVHTSVAIAQSSPPCNIEPPLTDTNNDGFADQYVSPQANIIRSELDCSELNIQAGAIIIDSTVLSRSIIEPDARVFRSSIDGTAIIKRGAKVIDSGVSGSGPQGGSRVTTVVGEGAIIARNSFVGDISTIAPDAHIIGSTVLFSLVGERSFVRESSLRLVEIRSDLRVLGATLEGGTSRPSDTLFLSGTRILPGATISGPIRFEENINVGRNVAIEGFKFMGGDSRIGADSKIGPGGDILELVTGKRVTIGGSPDIGVARIGADSDIGSLFTTGIDVKIGSSVVIGSVVSVGDLSLIGSSSKIGDDVIIGTEAIIGRDSVLGDSVMVGDSAVVRPRSVVPEGFIIEANTVYPNDYPNPTAN